AILAEPKGSTAERVSSSIRPAGPAAPAEHTARETFVRPANGLTEVVAHGRATLDLGRIRRIRARDAGRRPRRLLAARERDRPAARGRVEHRLDGAGARLRGRARRLAGARAGRG